MKALPTQKDGHLVLAAIRVLQHRDGRPPTDTDLAELLELPREEVAHWARGLAGLGAVHAIQNPFEVRFEVADHHLVDTLQGEDETPQLKEEVAAFQQRTKERQADLGEIFTQDPAKERRKTMARLEDELRRFQSSGRARPPLEPPTDDDGDDD